MGNSQAPKQSFSIEILLLSG